jgi:hypothetical protein
MAASRQSKVVPYHRTQFWPLLNTGADSRVVDKNGMNTHDSRKKLPALSHASTFPPEPVIRIASRCDYNQTNVGL